VVSAHKLMRVCIYVVEFARDVRFFSPDFEMQVFPIFQFSSLKRRVHKCTRARRRVALCREKREEEDSEKETVF
jgi:hypothetical protein